MMGNRLKGMIPAIITPLEKLDKEEKIDCRALKKIVDKIMDNGGNGVMVLGTTGEGPLHGKDVSVDMIRNSVDVMDGRGIVVAGTTAVTFSQSIYLADAAEEAGAEAVLNIPPFYFNLDDHEIERYYLAYADRCRLPVMIYHMPSVSRRTISPEVVRRLSRHGNIAGIKDSSGNFLLFQDLVEISKENKNFSVFMGKALLIYSALTVGASGTMTPAGNLLPEMEHEIYRFYQEGELEKARDIQAKLCRVFKILNANGRDLGVNLRGVLSVQGVAKNCTPDYLEPLSKESAEELNNMLQKVLETV